MCNGVSHDVSRVYHPEDDQLHRVKQLTECNKQVYTSYAAWLQKKQQTATMAPKVKKNAQQ